MNFLILPLKFITLFFFLNSRYDYENCASDPCNRMMTDLETLMNDPQFIGSVHQYEEKSYVVALADNFSYTDPIDGSLSSKQVLFSDNKNNQLILTVCIYCSKGTAYHFSRRVSYCYPSEWYWKLRCDGPSVR